MESCAAPALECVLIAGAADLRVAAHFARIVAVVEYAEFPADKSGGTLTASVPSGGTTLLGATVVFTAAPAAGWYVEDWEGGGTADCSGLECAVTVVSDAAVLVTVHFAEAAVVRVETVGEPPRGGVLSAELPGTGFAFLGATVTFTAAPAAKWYVTGWNNGGCANIGAAATPGEEKTVRVDGGRGFAGDREFCRCAGCCLRRDGGFGPADGRRRRGRRWRAERRLRTARRLCFWRRRRKTTRLRGGPTTTRKFAPGKTRAQWRRTRT